MLAQLMWFSRYNKLIALWDRILHKFSVRLSIGCIVPVHVKKPIIWNHMSTLSPLKTLHLWNPRTWIRNVRARGFLVHVLWVIILVCVPGCPLVGRVGCCQRYRCWLLLHLLLILHWRLGPKSLYFRCCSNKMWGVWWWIPSSPSLPDFSIPIGKIPQIGLKFSKVLSQHVKTQNMTKVA